MTIPSLLFGALLCSLYGVVFHLIAGGKLWKLIMYLVLAWIGFWAGHFLAASQGWMFASAGPLKLGMATLTSLLFLLGGYLLSQIRIEENTQR